MASSARTFLLALGALVALSPARGQVTITLATRKGVPVVPGAPHQVLSRLTCGFTAAHADGKPRAWHWTLEEPDGGRFVSGQGRARMAYQAPFVLAKRVVHVRVTDPAGGGTAVLALDVLPREGVPSRVQVALNTLAHPQVFGPVVDVPAATVMEGILPGYPPAGAVLRNVAKIQLVADPDPAMGGLRGRSLAIVDGALFRMDGPGSMTPIPFRGVLAPGMPSLGPGAFPRVDCVDVSVRPAGSSIGDRRRIVVVLSRTTEQNEENFICGMDPDGTVWPIAGVPLPLYGSSSVPLEGPGSSVSFTPKARTALDVQGNILVADHSRIRRIDPEGKVTLLAGGLSVRYTPWDGIRERAAFHDIAGLALDGASGDLYVSDRNSIRRVQPDGTVTTVLGVLGAKPPIPATPTPSRIAEGVPCLENPQGIAFQAGILYLCEPGNHRLLAFNPGDRTLHTLLQGDPNQPARPGPLPSFARERPLAECANLPSPFQIAVMDRRVLVVAGAGSGTSVIVGFDLPHGVFGEKELERKE